MNVLYHDGDRSGNYSGHAQLKDSHPDLEAWLVDHFSHPLTPYKLAFWAMVDNEEGAGWATRMMVWLDHADDEQAYFFEEALHDLFGEQECLEFSVEHYPKGPVTGTDFMEWQYLPHTQCLPAVEKPTVVGGLGVTVEGLPLSEAEKAAGILGYVAIGDHKLAAKVALRDFLASTKT